MRTLFQDLTRFFISVNANNNGSFIVSSLIDRAAVISMVEMGNIKLMNEERLAAVVFLFFTSRSISEDMISDRSSVSSRTCRLV